MAKSKAGRAFSALNHVLLALIAFATLYPFWYVLASSFSVPNEVARGNVFLLPKGFLLDSYNVVFNIEYFWSSYANTVFYTVAGTFISMLITTLGAYALAAPGLPGRTLFSFFISFTMWFSAGMIPTYLNLKDLGLINTRASILVGFAVSAFNVILMRTFFQSIPISLRDSAYIDGANDLTVFGRIFLPLSKPALATIGLYYGIGRWNGYFWSMLLLHDMNKVPLQVLLKKLIVEMQAANEMRDSYRSVLDYNTMSNETVIYATIIVSIVPIIIAFPILQKYFVKGIMIGSIKG
jgi:putative aldouronate transport system permease protein